MLDVPQILSVAPEAKVKSTSLIKPPKLPASETIVKNVVKLPLRFLTVPEKFVPPNEFPDKPTALV